MPASLAPDTNLHPIVVQTSSPSSSVLNFHGGHDASKPPKETRARQYPSSPLSQTSFSTESAAPAPAILGFRGDEAPSRPTTSHSKLQTDTRRGSALPAPSAASLKPSSRLSQLVAPRLRSSLIINPKPATSPPVQTKPPAHRAQSSTPGSKFTKPAKTDGSGKGYVDLLDAQSEFKPADFYSRVKASGARDYGEDVADRNIGANGCDLDSQPVQAFYAVRPKASSRTIDQRRPFSSWNRPSDFRDDAEDGVYRPQVMKQASIDSALWSKSLNSSHQAFFGRGDVPTVLSAASLQKNRALQRQAFNVIAQSTSMGTYSTPSLADIDAIQEQHRLVNRKMRSRSLQVSVHDANQLVSAWDTTSPESENGSADAMAYSSPAIVRPSTSGGLPRRVSAASQKDSAALSRYEHSEDAPRFGVNNQPILSPQPTSFRLSASLASSAFTASNKRPSTMHSMQSIRRPQQAVLEPHGTLPDLSNLPYHLKERALNFKEDWHDDMTDRESAPSPCKLLKSKVLFLASWLFFVLTSISH